MFHDLCRLCTGLRWLGFYKEVKKYPKVLETALVFENRKQLVATMVREQFAVEFADQGSNRKRNEQQAYAWWLDCLQDIEGE